MKIIRTIKITNEQFYDYLEQQLIEDIKNSQHKKISASDIQKGLKYKRRMPNLNLLLKFIFNNM